MSIKVEDIHQSSKTWASLYPAPQWGLKRCGCSSRGLGFNSQETHGDSELSVTLVPQTPMTLSDLHRHACGALK